MKHSLLISILTFTLTNITLLAQIPKSISYQGLLSNSNGTIVADGIYSVTINLYDVSLEGSALWTEAHTTMTKDGIFNLILGSTTPLSLPFDKQYWLGLSIDGGDELIPRTKLTSSAYSFNTLNIPNNIVSGEKVVDGSLVRSVNDFTDDVIISAGSNIEITQAENILTISAISSSGNLELPYIGNTSTSENAFSVTNNGNGNSIYSKNTSNGSVTAGYFEIDNASSSSDAIFSKTNSSGNAIYGYTSGTGSAGKFSINNVNNNDYTISAETNGKGIGGYFRIDNSSSINNALHAVTNSSGSALFGYSTGDGQALSCKINNLLNTNEALFAVTNGLGKAARFIIDNISNTSEAIYSRTNGAGVTIFAENINSQGTAGRFEIFNSSNAKMALQAVTNGTGTAVYGSANNNGSIGNYGGFFKASGTIGYGVWAEANNTSGVNYGGHFSTASTSGRAIRGHATNTSGENYGGAFRADGDNSRAVWAFGQAFDYYAAGPGVNYGAASSIRWKNNINEISNPLEKILELRGVYFDWDLEHGNKHDLGMIAEEVGKVLPEIVVYEENGVDAEGIDYGKLTPLLVEAIKAQQKIILELKNDIIELKGLLK